MRNLTLSENLYVSGGVNNGNGVHIDITATNTQYLHVTVDTYQQSVTTTTPSVTNQNNIYVYK